MGFGCASSSPFRLLPPAAAPLPTSYLQNHKHLVAAISSSRPSSSARRLGLKSFVPKPPSAISMNPSPSSSASAATATRCGRSEESDPSTDSSPVPPRAVPTELAEKLVYDALVWSSLHGLVVGDRNVQRSGNVPGVGLVHAPFALLPMPFPKGYWRQACELAPIFNELVDRVSLDGKFLQESLSRTRKVDDFTGRLLDIHSEIMGMNKNEDIRLGLHRSDYMLDAETNLLFQIELNTISSSFPGLSCLVTELHRNLLNLYGKELGLDSRRVPGNTAVSRYAEALAKAWNEYGDNRAVVMVVVQTEERNMYDQHWLCAVLKDVYPLIIMMNG